MKHRSKWRVTDFASRSPGRFRPGFSFLGAGWSSPVARQAHNLKVAGSNPAPATKNIKIQLFKAPMTLLRLGGFCVMSLKFVDFLVTSCQVFDLNPANECAYILTQVL